MSFIEYIIQNKIQIMSLVMEHIELTAIAVGLAILIGIPLGILICYVKELNKIILGTINIIQAIPSLALLGLSIPFLGIGTLPAVIVVILYSLLPIVKNTYIGINNISPQVIEAAKGIGLTKFQILTKIQIPLALPVIMAGIRISAVTAVGLMTIAAFIGAGGLGYLVFSGIRTVNNSQILAGAIPACLLALLVDFIAAIIEKVVTPGNLQNSYKAKNKKKIKFIMRIVSIGVCIFLCAFIFSSMQTKAGDEKMIRIGTKDFSEQLILGHLVADIIEENTDITVDRKINLGGTQVCFSALKANDIDLYIEYTGTAYGDLLGHPPSSDMNKIYYGVTEEFKEKFDIVVLKQMNFNNTYTIAVTPETALKYNLKTISDLAKVANKLRAGTTLEFLNREDGLVGLKKKYHFKMKEELGLDGSSRYMALMNQEVDIVDAFATDGLLKKFSLKILTDDKKVFPPYYAVPIVRAEIIQKYPEIIPLLEQLGTVLTDEVMMNLNYKVDELQMEPDKVAKDFLKEKGLIK